MVFKVLLSNLKSKVDELDVDKLVAVPVDLSKLSDAVKNDIVNKTEYDELFKKVIKTTDSDLVKKDNYDTKIGKTKKKTLDKYKYIINININNK